MATKKTSKKSRTVPKKIESHSAEIARKNFWLKQGLEPVTAGFTVNRVLTSESEVCKKWYIRDEVWSDEKKLTTVRVGHFSQEKRRLKITTSFELIKEHCKNAFTSKRKIFINVKVVRFDNEKFSVLIIKKTVGLSYN